MMQKSLATVVSNQVSQSRSTLWKTLGQFWRVVGAIACVMVIWANFGGASVAIAAPDPYITQYMKVFPSKPATMTMDAAGTTQEFTYDDMIEGKELFAQNCLSCHVGGSTLSSPDVSLSLDALKGATPPRDTVEAMMTYIRHPMAYDGTDDNYSCREVDESWLSNDQVSKISAFILRAAEYAKGWGTSQF